MTVFYRKYRPQKFADLAGQEHIVQNLLNMLTSGKISHGYLFSGPRGTEKTSTARIFAKALNCQLYAKESKNPKFGEPCGKCVSCLAVADGSHLDLIEIDAASNRGIDEIRDLREKIKLSPVSCRFKVYIIDEAHMLTTDAFNALLKTLEEPPAHAVFILCTTAAGKLPPTIVSRLSRFNFARASVAHIVAALSKIAKAEGIKAEKEAFSEIAKAADGSFRDAVSILDQLAPSGKLITAKDAAAFGGIGGWNSLADFIDATAGKDLKRAIGLIEKFAQGGGDVSLFIRELVLAFEKMLFIKIGVGSNVFNDMDEDQKIELEEFSGKFSFSDLQNIIKILMLAESEMKIYPMPKIPLVLAACKICGEPQEEATPASQAKRGEKVTNVTKDVKVQKGKIKSLAQIEAKWDQFLEKVKGVNVHLVAILRSARPAAFSGDILTIEVYFRFHKDKLEEPKINKMLAEFLEELLQAKILLKFVLAQRQNTAPKAVLKSDVAEIAGGDLSKIAQEIFSK